MEDFYNQKIRVAADKIDGAVSKVFAQKLCLADEVKEDIKNIIRGEILSIMRYCYRHPDKLSNYFKE